MPSRNGVFFAADAWSGLRCTIGAPFLGKRGKAEEFARIGTTGRTISVERFARAADRDEVALLLNCYGCAAPAIYRRRGSNGRRATFAAHHTGQGSECLVISPWPVATSRAT